MIFWAIYNIGRGGNFGKNNHGDGEGDNDPGDKKEKMERSIDKITDDLISVT